MYLLDTHSFVWSLLGDKQLSPTVQQILKQRGNAVYVSSVSFYELALKYHLGKWPQAQAIVQNASQLMNRMQYEELTLNIEHSLAAAALPLSHRDPFDRLIVAQAITEDYVLITKDSALSQLGAKVIW